MLYTLFVFLVIYNVCINIKKNILRLKVLVIIIGNRREKQFVKVKIASFLPLLPYLMQRIALLAPPIVVGKGKLKNFKS